MSVDGGKRSGIRVKHRVEYALFRLLAGVLNALPYRVALALGWAIAAILFHGLRYRRRETLRRIRSVFGPDLAESRARWIAWCSLRNLTFNAVEMLRIRQFDRADLQRMMPGLEEAVAEARRLLAERGGGGAILAIPHMGNWDLAGSACFLAGTPIFSVAARQRNRLMNDYINRLRAGHGMDILERGAGTLRDVTQRLRDGSFFAILPDTRARKPDLTLPFLGGEANLARGMASFARSAQVPILPVIVRRQGWTRFEVTVHPPVFPDASLDKATDLRRITASVTATIDRAIHEAPEQWFWYNRRWVLDPVTS